MAVTPARARPADLPALLRGARGAISGSDLARRLGLSRAAVHKRIERLRALGYRVTGTNRVGYRLRASPDALDGTRLPGGAVRVFSHHRVLPSTQEAAKARALAGAPAGTLVTADRQTAGRGRLGRRWISPRGGLWYSLVLRPAVPPASVPALALVAALDWVRAIRRVTGLPARVKWPNDVWVGKRKVAGVLTEMSSEVDRVHWVVLGVGVNVNNRAPRGTAAPAVSLAEAAGHAVSRQDLLALWLTSFARSLREFERRGFPAFRRAYEAFSLLRGRAVVCATPNGVVRGRARGVDGDGRLRVKTARGVVLVGHAEVRLRRGLIGGRP